MAGATEPCMQSQARRHPALLRFDPLRSRSVMSIPIIGLADTRFEIDPRPPAERREFGNIEKFSRGAVGLGRVEDKPARVANDIGDDAGELHNRQILACADVYGFLIGPGLHKKYGCVCKVVAMEELAARAAAAPDLHGSVAKPDSGVDLGEERRQDMARQ